MPVPRLTPGIALTLDRPRTLRMDKQSIFVAERELCALWKRQRNILSIFADVTTLTMNDIAVLLRQALLDDDPTLTLEQTQDILDFDKVGDVLTALMAAWNAATQPAVPQEVNGSEAPLSFPGVPSGPSPVLS